MSFLDISEEEIKLMQEREAILCQRYYERNKDKKNINLREYKMDLTLEDCDLIEKYSDLLYQMAWKRRKILIDRVIEQLDRIESCGYSFFDSRNRNDISDISLFNFGIQTNRTLFIDLEDIESFYVYDKSEYRYHLEFKFKGCFVNKIQCLTELNSLNKDIILKITDALNTIFNMMNNFKWPTY